MAGRIWYKQFQPEPARIAIMLILLLLVSQTAIAQRAVSVQIDGRTINAPAFQYTSLSGQIFTVPIIPAESIAQMIRNPPKNPNEIRIWRGPKNVFFVDTGANITPQLFARASSQYVKGITYNDNFEPRNYLGVSLEAMSPELQGIINQSGILHSQNRWSVFIAKRWPEDTIEAVRQAEFANGNRDRAAIEQRVAQEVSRRASNTIRHEAVHAFINNDDVFFNRVRSIWFNELTEAEREQIRNGWGGRAAGSFRIMNERTGAWQTMPENIRNALMQAWGPDVEGKTIQEFGAYLIGNRNYDQQNGGFPLTNELKQKLDRISARSLTDPAFASLNSEKPVQGIASTQPPKEHPHQPVQPEPKPIQEPTPPGKPTEPISRPTPPIEPVTPTPIEPLKPEEPLPEIPREPSFVLPAEPETGECNNIIDCLNNLNKFVVFQVFSSLPKEQEQANNEKEAKQPE